MSHFTFRAIAGVFAFLYTLISINACSPKGDAPVVIPVDDVPLEEQDEVIHILQSRGEISQQLQQAIDLYTGPNGNVRISVQTVGNQSDYQVALRSKLLAGDKVDIFHLFSQQETKELLPYLEELSDLDWIHSAMNGTLDAVTLEEGVFGIPYSVEGVGLIANRNIFEVAGIPLADIVTFEDMEEAFAALQELIDSGELAESFPDLEAVTEFAAADPALLCETVGNVALSGVFPSVGSASRADYLELGDSEAAEKFITMMALYSSCTRWAQLNETGDVQQVENGFANQRVAVILHNANVYQRIYDANPNLENRLRLMPVPLEGRPQSYIYTGVPAYWAVNYNSSEGAKDSAKKFLTWLYQSDSGSTVVAARFKAVSPYQDTAKDTGVSIHNQMLDYLERERSLPMIHREFPRDWGEEVLAGGIQSYFNRETDWESLMDLWQTEWHIRQ